MLCLIIICVSEYLKKMTLRDLIYSDIFLDHSVLPVLMKSTGHLKTLQRKNKKQKNTLQ